LRSFVPKPAKIDSYVALVCINDTFELTVTVKYCYTLRKFAFVTISKISHLAIIALIVANVNTVKIIILMQELSFMVQKL